MANKQNKLVPLGAQFMGRDVYISIPADIHAMDEHYELTRAKGAWRALMEMAKDTPPKAKAARGEP